MWPKLWGKSTDEKVVDLPTDVNSCSFACKLCFPSYIHKLVYTDSYAEPYLSALCCQVKHPPHGLFVLFQLNPERIRLTWFSSISNFNMNLGWVQYQCLGSTPGLRGANSLSFSVSVCIHARLSDWWLTVGRPVNRPTNWKPDKQTDGQLQDH